MLKFLSIHNFIIVSNLELDFLDGFTALTGETGAGKSILIDALSLALGGRGDASLVRAGCDKLDITAEFDTQGLENLKAWLIEQEFEGDGDICLMRRVIDNSGRSRSFINGSSATLQQLRDAGEKLLDIHGQHAHQTLLRAEKQRELLDNYAGATQQVEAVAIKFKEWQALKRRYQSLSENAESLGAEREILEFQRDEIESLNFNFSEWIELQDQHARMTHAGNLLAAAAFSIENLSESDVSCLAQLNSVITRVKDEVVHDSSLEEVVGLLDSAQAEIQEVIYFLRHYQQRFEQDSGLLVALDQRIQNVLTIARKHRVPPEKLEEALQRILARLEELGGNINLAELSEQVQFAALDYLQIAKQLQSIRRAAAEKLSCEISAAMQTLAMQGGVFSVELQPLVDGNAYGLELVDFQVATNTGVIKRSLAKVASGGELSRISLAIQVATSQFSQVPTLIFDEVDSGIGGRVAEIVGHLLKQLGKTYQVLCVTHLPQVAAAADQQWQVSKYVENNVTLSHIVALDHDKRILEIARMLGGVTITETTRKHAAEMLGFAV